MLQVHIDGENKSTALIQGTAFNCNSREEDGATIRDAIGRVKRGWTKWPPLGAFLMLESRTSPVFTAEMTKFNNSTFQHLHH
jgi:hypothetical protein